MARLFQSPLGAGQIHNDGVSVCIRIGIYAANRASFSLIVDEQFDCVARLLLEGSAHPNTRGLFELVQKLAWFRPSFELSCS